MASLLRKLKLKKSGGDQGGGTNGTSKSHNPHPNRHRHHQSASSNAISTSTVPTPATTSRRSSHHALSSSSIYTFEALPFTNYSLFEEDYNRNQLRIHVNPHTDNKYVFLPNTPVEVSVSVERRHGAHLFNQFLYTIKLQHDKYTWTVTRVYKEIKEVHGVLSHIVKAELGHACSDIPKENINPDWPMFPNLHLRMEFHQEFHQFETHGKLIEEYLRRLLTYPPYRDHPAVINLLGISPLSFIVDTGPSYIEGYFYKRSGDNIYYSDITHLKICCDSLKIFHAKRWFCVKDTYIAYMNTYANYEVRFLLLVDNEFKCRTTISMGAYHVISIKNSQRTLFLKCKSSEQQHMWHEKIQHMLQVTGRDFHKSNPYDSYAPVREHQQCHWYVNSSKYMEDVLMAIKNAREEIYICDWWLCPEVFLKRPSSHDLQYRLDKVLLSKSKEGVKIYILIFKEVHFTYALMSARVRNVLTQNGKNPNVKVLRHPDHTPTGVFLWSHHEKFVIIDQSVAFVGGIDLCFGRWDNDHHWLVDLGRHENVRDIAPSSPAQHYATTSSTPAAIETATKEMPRRRKTDGASIEQQKIVDMLMGEPHHHHYHQQSSRHGSAVLGSNVATGGGEHHHHHAHLHNLLHMHNPHRKKAISESHADENRDRIDNDLELVRMGKTTSSLATEGDENESKISNVIKKYFHHQPTSHSEEKNIDYIDIARPDSVDIDIDAQSNTGDHTKRQGLRQKMHELKEVMLKANRNQTKPLRRVSESSKYDEGGGSSGGSGIASRNVAFDQASIDIVPMPEPGPVCSLEEDAKAAVSALPHSFSYPQQNQSSVHHKSSFQSSGGGESGGYYWYGKDYINSYVSDIRDIDDFSKDLFDRTSIPRMPWRDQALVIFGFGARDLARHFISRWNQVKREKESDNPTYPYLFPKTYAEPWSYNYHEWFKDQTYTCSTQILRSLDRWSGGISKTEFSILKAYIDLISKAEHFIYIENQFFITTCDPAKDDDVRNSIGLALAERIIRAHKEKKRFRVYVVLPLLPGFERINCMKAMQYLNLRSILNGEFSIYAMLKRNGIVNPEEYITIHGMRNWDVLMGKLVQEIIYVHSKLMIVDDKHVICGSANINDRSMLGKRDSEIAVHVQDEEFVEARVDGQTKQVGKYAHSLRQKIFKLHMGIYFNNNPEGIDVSDCVCDEFYHMFKKHSSQNTSVYDEVFNCLPSNNIQTFQDLKNYLNRECLSQTKPLDAKIKLETMVKGYVTDFPLEFLSKEEDFFPDLNTAEGIVPIQIWT